MLTGRMQDALNGQVNAELYSAYLYLSMSAYFESLNLPGFASWMRVQRLEELVHGLKLFDYVVEAGGRVWLTAIEGPRTEWDGPLATFEAVLAHEQKVTGLIKDLVKVASEEGDPETEAFLQWFVKEQEEEEESAEKVVNKIKEAGENFSGLDGELAQRS